MTLDETADKEDMSIVLLTGLFILAAPDGTAAFKTTPEQHAHLARIRAAVYSRNISSDWLDFVKRYDEAKRQDWAERYAALSAAGKALTAENTSGGPRQEQVRRSLATESQLYLYTEWRDNTIQALKRLGTELKSQQAAFNVCANEYGPYACMLLRKRLGLSPLP